MARVPEGPMTLVSGLKCVQSWQIFIVIPASWILICAS
jgi:hypothetical protein